MNERPREGKRDSECTREIFLYVRGRVCACACECEYGWCRIGCCCVCVYVPECKTWTHCERWVCEHKNRGTEKDRNIANTIDAWDSARCSRSPARSFYLSVLWCAVFCICCSLINAWMLFFTEVRVQYTCKSSAVVVFIFVVIAASLSHSLSLSLLTSLFVFMERWRASNYIRDKYTRLLCYAMLCSTNFFLKCLLFFHHSL